MTETPVDVASIPVDAVLPDPTGQPADVAPIVVVTP